LPFVKKVEPVETNIIIFEVEDEKAIMDHLSKNKVVISNMGSGKLRMVTHLDYTAENQEVLMDILRKYSEK
ncbi:threonine aldolase, partial [Nonlabens dokdonensis]